MGKKIGVALLCIALVVLSCVVGYTVGSGISRKAFGIVLDDNERIRGLIDVRDADLDQARRTIGEVRDALGSIGRGIDGTIERAGSIKGTNGQLREILAGYRDAAIKCRDLESWLDR